MRRKKKTGNTGAPVSGEALQRSREQEQELTGAAGDGELEVRCIDAMYRNLAAATYELRGLVLQITTSIPEPEAESERATSSMQQKNDKTGSTVITQSCEFEYLKPLLLDQLWQLFDPLTRVQPLVQIDPWKASKRGLAGIGGLLREVEATLGRLSSTLEVLEASIGADIVAELLRIDAEAVERASVMRGAAQKDKLTGDEEPWRDLVEPPRTFSELIGYCVARLESFHGWKPLAPDPLSLSFALNKPANNPKAAMEFLAEEHTMRGGLGGLGREHIGYQLWTLHAALGVNWMARHGAIDSVASLIEDIEKGDNPACIALENVKVQYLVDTHVTRALHEGYFAVATQPNMLSPYSTLCTHLFKFSSFQTLFRVSDAELVGLLTTAAPHTDVRSSLRVLCGASRRVLTSTARQGAAVLTSVLTSTARQGAAAQQRRGVAGTVRKLCGGLIAPEPVLLYGLGNWQELFRFAWSLPAILPSRPALSAAAITKTGNAVTLDETR